MRPPHVNPTRLLASLRDKGVNLWTSGGRLHYEASPSALSGEDLNSLRACRQEILRLLAEAEPLHTPLAYSQRAHWNLYKLAERGSRRQVASAVRLRGQLCIDALENCVEEVVKRHPALRTRFTMEGQRPLQRVEAALPIRLETVDLTWVARTSQSAEVTRLIEETTLERIDPAVDAPLAVKLVKLGDREHVLVVAMDHMISDGFSLNVVLRDLFAFYVQAITGHPASLPPVRMHFVDYALAQPNAEQKWLEKHGSYWNSRIAGCDRVRFPCDVSEGAGARLGRGTVSVTIGGPLKTQLREWCRANRTTLVMSLFAAYSALVLRWCDTREALIPYQSDGRFSADMEDAVGYFATVLYLHMQVSEADTFADLAGRAMEEYCRAYEHADFSYFAAQDSPPAFTRNTTFNWLPQAGFKVDVSGLEGSPQELSCEPIRFLYCAPRDLQIDKEPFVLLSDSEEEVIGDVYFPLNRYSVARMERFAQNFLWFVEAMVRFPMQRVKDLQLQ